MTAYQEKLNNLPSQVRGFADSVVGIDLNLQICKQNGLIGDDILRNTELVADLFFKELSFKDLVSKIKEVFRFDDFRVKKLAADIVGIRLLVVDQEWFNGGASAFLNSLDVPPDNYQKIVVSQKAALQKEKEEDAIEEAERKAEKEAAVDSNAAEAVPVNEKSVEIGDFKINWDLEREEILKTFKNGLADIISAGANEEELNDVLAYLLADRGEPFRAELEKILLNNNEVLTFSKFMIDGRQTSPVISAWLKNFISEFGSANFDNLTLTKFITNSPNAKMLDEEGKKSVRRLLFLYRNIKFFPQSMPNTTGEGWQILPLDIPEDEKLSQVKEKIDNRIKEDRVEAANLPSREEIKKNEEADKNIADLRQAAGKYPENSLQRKAVEAEIEKIEKKKN
jgi:hypothetical protein